MAESYDEEIRKLKLNLQNAETTYGKDSKPYTIIKAILDQFQSSQGQSSTNLPSFKNLVIRPKKTT